MHLNALSVTKLLFLFYFINKNKIGTFLKKKNCIILQLTLSHKSKK